MAQIEFRVKVIKSPDGTTATLAEVDGSIDASTITQFQQVMDKLVERGVKNFVDWYRGYARYQDRTTRPIPVFILEPAVETGSTG